MVRFALGVVAVFLGMTASVAFSQEQTVAPVAATSVQAMAAAQAGVDPAGAAASGADRTQGIRFDVVSVRPSAPSGMPAHGFVIQDRPDGIVASWQTLAKLIQYAYGIGLLPSRDQIIGLPDWATSQTYEIEAKMSPEDIAGFRKLDRTGQKESREAMMQAMLADRFQLTIHRGSRQAKIYELVVGKGGAKLDDGATDKTPLRLGTNEDGSTYSGFQFNLHNTVAQEVSTESLAVFLSRSLAGLDRRVVDKTGLTGAYNFTLTWSVYPPPNTGLAGTASDPVPSIFSALEKVGLKLQPTMGTLDTIVVDHVEKPSAN